VARVLTPIEEIRARFTALQGPLAFFDGPGGTQVPDSVIDAIGSYLRTANANLGGPFATSRETDELVDIAHLTAARFLGARPSDVNFALSRTASREWTAGEDEIVCTRLDHDANVAPWLEIARDKSLVVRFADVDDECRLDLDQLRSLLSDRTRVVAYPWASNAVGTVTPVADVASLAHDAGALAWVDAVHYAPHGPIDVAAAGADVLLCSPYKFYGPHLGLAYVRQEVAERWRSYKVRPADHPFETGTQAHELLAGFVAAVDYLGDVGWETIVERERRLGQQFLDGLPAEWTLYGIPSMEDRVATFAITHPRAAPGEAASYLGERGFATWHGDYYAVEIMNRLDLVEGALRVGVVHYNTEDEVARLLAALAAI
jgi:cysteine desulfurase family protein (TIGR01976 family)